MKKQILWLAAALLLVPQTVAAARFGGGDSYSIPRGETVNENIYAAGGQMTIDGTVNGDIYAAGGTVMLGGTVTNDVVVAGGTVQMNGVIEEDLRMAGGNIMMNGTVRGETIMAGGTVIFSGNASTTGEVILAGGQVTLDGVMSGEVTVYGGDITVRGQINGPLTIRAERVVFESSAVVTGPVSYSSPTEATIQSGAALSGGVTYHQIERREPVKRDAGAIIGAAWFMSWLMALALGAALYLLLRRPVHRVIGVAGQMTAKSLLTGLVTLVVVPIALIFIFITIIGIPIAIAVLLTHILLMIFGGAIGGMFVGSLVAKLVKKTADYPVTWATVLCGVTLMSIFGLIPIIGWIARFAFFLIGFGAILVWAWEGRRGDVVANAPLQ